MEILTLLIARQLTKSSLLFLNKSVLLSLCLFVACNVLCYDCFDDSLDAWTLLWQVWELQRSVFISLSGSSFVLYFISLSCILLVLFSYFKQFLF